MNFDFQVPSEYSELLLELFCCKVMHKLVKSLKCDFKVAHLNSYYRKKNSKGKDSGMTSYRSTH